MYHGTDRIRGVGALSNNSVPRNQEKLAGEPISGRSFEITFPKPIERVPLAIVCLLQGLGITESHKGHVLVVDFLETQTMKVVVDPRTSGRTVTICNASKELTANFDVPLGCRFRSKQ